MMEVYDIIFICTLIIAAVALFVVLLVTGKRKPIDKESSLHTDITTGYSFVIEKRNILLRSSVIWLVIYYWIVLTSILATIFVIYITNFSESQEPEYVSLKVFIYSCFSLFASVALFVVDPKRNAEKYRESFMKLDKYLNRIDFCKKCDQQKLCSDCSVNDTEHSCAVNVLDACEEIINEANK